MTPSMDEGVVAYQELMPRLVRGTCARYRCFDRDARLLTRVAISMACVGGILSRLSGSFGSVQYEER